MATEGVLERRDEDLSVEHWDAATTDELLGALTDALQAEGKSLMRLAGIVRECHRRSIETPMLSPGFRQYLIAIADGLLNAAAAQRFLGTAVAAHLQHLSRAEQERLAGGGHVTVYSFENGKVDKRQMDPLKLDRFEFHQVFGPDGIRDAAGQRSYLEGLKQLTEIARVQPKDEPYVAKKGRSRSLVVPKATEISKQQYLAFLSEMVA